MRLDHRLLTLLLVLAVGVQPADAQKRAEVRAAPRPDDVCEPGTAHAFLDVGGVRAALYGTGGLFQREGSSVYEVPKGSGKRAVFASGLWVAGLADGHLRFAGSRYGPWEFWPGPLDATGEATADLCAAHDRIWVVRTADLAAYDATGAATDDLREWPVAAGAPFYLDADADGAQGGTEPTVALRPGDAGYGARALDLAAGERPVVFGAQTAWWVMNDRGGEHTWGDQPPVGVEVRVTAWAVADAGRPALDESTFYRYEIRSHGPEPLDPAYVGIYVDGDIGGLDDDFLHSDSTRSMLVFYNADETDGTAGGYGVPPALGVDVLSGAQGTMDASRRPSAIPEYEEGNTAFSMLQGLWRDGSPLREGMDGYNTDGPPIRWVYPGDPVAGAFWSDENWDGDGLRGRPHDRQGVLSVDLGAVQPGQEVTVDIGILFAQGTDRLDSVARVRAVSDAAQAGYDDGSLFRAVEARPEPEAPTSAPALTAPADGAAFYEAPLPFAWTAADGATRYRVEIAATDAFEDPLRFLVPGTSFVAAPDLLPANQPAPVFWRVVPTNGAADGPPSEARQVTSYRYAPGPILLANGQPAFVEVVGPGGVDPCGPEAGSTDGCAEAFGNGIYRSPNSTGDYIGDSVGDGTEGSISAFTPSEFEVRFTAEGSVAYYPFTTGRLIRVPFEVWDIGQVAPGQPNDPADDVQMVPHLFTVADPVLECAFDYVGPSQFGLGPITQRIYAYYAADDDYAAFEAEAAPLIDADPDGCPAHPATAGAAALIDGGRGRPLQRFVLEQASDAGIDALEGTVIRFYTADRLPVAAADRPEAGGLAVSVRPNPSASVATVDYRLAEAGPVRLRLVDVLGREVAVLAEGDRAAGDHHVSVDAAALASGVYLVVLQSGAQRAVRTLTVVR